MLEDIKIILSDVLQLEERAAEFTIDTRLMGSLPELDSFAVVSLITALEEQYEFVADDDEISAETFSTVGSLVSFVEGKCNA